MILIKLYKYDRAKGADGYRGEDLTKYVLQGAHNHEDITQELDYSEVTLFDYPSKIAFTPESKFIIDICYGSYKKSVIPPSIEPQIVEDFSILKTLHRIVKEDAVQLPVLSDQTLYTHNITFIEPSAIAQKRIVDNIAVTYKLQDVSLDTKTTYDLDAKNGFTSDSNIFTPSIEFGAQVRETDSPQYRYYGKQLKFESPVLVSYGSVTSSDKKYLQVNGSVTASIKIPRLLLRGGKKDVKAFSNWYPISVTWALLVQDLYGNEIPAENQSGEILEDSDLSEIFGATTYTGDSYDATAKKTWLIEDIGNNRYSQLAESVTPRIRKYTSDSITTQPNYTISFTLLPNRQYFLTVQPKIYDDQSSVKYPGDDIKQTIYDRISKSEWWRLLFFNENYYHDIMYSTVSVDFYTQTAAFVTYTEESIQEVITSAIPYTTLNLIKKAILNSRTIEKTSGVPVGDLNHQDQTTGVLDYMCPFYIDNAFVQELANTQVVESFFQNKNLWEIMLEAGNYIHAIPELVFGNDNKFMLTFNRLGQTTESREGGIQTSILNTQGIDDYICATNSYVDNFVQLGGGIDEWVAPKTTDSSALVYNDTAEIVTSKKIIELLQLEIKCNTSGYDSLGINEGAVGDATKYIYEENVYKLLSVEFNQVPNKGIAMYYTLGEDKIKGGDYRLPRAQTDIYNDYTIKKLIYVALTGMYPTSASGSTTGYWTNIRVSDFSFHIRYRTKDSVRLSHVRPDIRKFLLNAIYDGQPQHWQVNNQTDTLIDSQKFGSKIYGSLLRTGNNEYTETEWVSLPSDTRQKGEVRKINGEIYYVATVDNIYYNDHIESTVKYSKDYNQLSKVIGIPSEPRFYEVSEQSQIRRDVAINDYLLISLTDTNVSPTINTYFMSMRIMRNMMFGVSSFSYPRYVLTAFKGDDTNGVDSRNFGDPNLYKEVLSPINSYPSGNTLVFEWEMVDNFSAGDQVSEITVPDIGNANDVYSTLKAVKYTDKYGKASLFDFFIFENIDFSNNFEYIKELPETPYSAKQGSAHFIGDINLFATNVKVNDTNYNGRGLTLLKDCREKIAFNYNLIAITDSDTLITSQYLFVEKKTNPVLVCLTEEINKFGNGTISTAAIFYQHTLSTTDFRTITTTNIYGKSCSSKSSLKVSTILAGLDDKYFSGEGGVQIHAIAICFDFDSNQPTNKFSIARNIPTPTNKVDTIRDWYFGTPVATFFQKNLD